MERLYWDTIEYNNRKIFFTVSNLGLNFVSSPGQKISEFYDFYQNDPYDYEFKYDELKTAGIKADLSNYFSGNKKTNFDIRLDPTGFGTEMQQDVLKAVMQIPYGQTRTYTQIAEMIGRPNAARAVAHAIAINPVLFVIPCHRVIRSNGEIGEYRGGSELKVELIEFEKQNLLKKSLVKRVFPKINQLGRADR